MCRKGVLPVEDREDFGVELAAGLEEGSRELGVREDVVGAVAAGG